MFSFTEKENSSSTIENSPSYKQVQLEFAKQRSKE